MRNLKTVLGEAGIGASLNCEQKRRKSSTGNDGEPGLS